MPAKGPDRPVYEVAPPLVSGHGSKRVDPRRKWSERLATLLTHGDPRVEPASSRRSFSSWPPRVRSHPGRLRSPPVLPPLHSHRQEGARPLRFGRRRRKLPPASQIGSQIASHNRVALLPSKGGHSMAGSPSFLPLADMASDRSPCCNHELHGSGKSTTLPLHPDLW
jgi:hypothetical protein